MDPAKLSELEKLKILESRIGSTPLYEYCAQELLGASKCRIFIKAEYRNPSGSHYDRVYLTLFGKDLALIQELRKKGPYCLIEVSSGNAGASFAWFCGELGYPCRVILPTAVPTGFRRHITTLNPQAEVVFAPDRDKYVQSAAQFLQDHLSGKGPRKFHILNHSRRRETLEATKALGRECVEQLGNLGVKELHYYVVACGNGATIVGPGSALKEVYQDLKIIAFEPEVAPVGHSVIAHGTPAYKLHNLFGTGAFGVKFPFLEKEEYGFKKLVSEMMLVTKADIENCERFRYKVAACVGRTSLASLHCVIKLIEERSIKNGNFLIVFYDRGEKYDWII